MHMSTYSVDHCIKQLDQHILHYQQKQLKCVLGILNAKITITTSEIDSYLIISLQTY